MSTHASALDYAWEDRIEGRPAAALARAHRVLSRSPGSLEALLLVSDVLGAEGKSALARRCAERLVPAFTARGDLPSAVAAARLAERTGGSVQPLLATVASRFGGGPKDRDSSMRPPALPVKVGKELDGEPTLDQAIEAASEAVELWLTKPLPADEEAPLLPLFGRLDSAGLQALLSAFQLRLAGRDTAVITEGEEGKEAFLVVRGGLRAERDGVQLAELGPGSLFGEMAIVTAAPRAASVTAAEATLLLSASRDELEKVARRQPAVGKELSAFCRRRMIANLLRVSPLLAAVDPAARPEVVQRFVARTFKPGSHLIRRGAETQGLFLLAGGQVEVRGVDADGEALHLANLGAGDVVGEISVVLRRPATADVVATHPTVALELTRTAFREAIREHPNLLHELYELAAKREEETRSVVAMKPLDVEEVVLL